MTTIARMISDAKTRTDDLPVFAARRLSIVLDNPPTVKESSALVAMPDLFLRRFLSALRP